MAPKLFILILHSDPAKIIQNSYKPTLQDQDVTIFVKKPTNEGDGYTCAMSVAGESEDYLGKRNSKSIFGTGAEIQDSDLADINSVASTTIIYSFESMPDIGVPMRGLLDYLLSLTPNAETTFPNIVALRQVFVAGGNFTGNICAANGLMSGEMVHTYTLPAAEPARNATFTATSKNDILALIKDIMPKVAYDGFNPTAVREAFIKKEGKDSKTIRNLLLAFTAYAFIGNNVAKLTVRRVDVETGKKLMEAVSQMGVKKQDRTREGLTLPRIAIAFMPEYLAFRRFIAEDLQSQTSSTISVHYKDIAFHGCPEIRGMAGYAEFHKEFSTYIHSGKKGEETDPEDAKFKKSYARWSKVSIAGYQKDTKIHTRMTTVVGWTARTPSQVYSFISEGINNAYP